MTKADRPDEPARGPAGAATPPRPMSMRPGASLLRQANAGLRSALALFQEGAFQLGGVGKHGVPVLPTFRRDYLYTVREPELIRDVLVARQADFPKSRLMRNMLEDLIGSSIFVANGETWRWRRAIVDAALEQARVRDVMQRMRDAADAMVERLLRAVDAAGDSAGAVVQIDRETTHFAADVIFRTLFSEPIDDEDARRIIASFETYQGLAYAHGMLRLARIPVGLLPGAGRRRRAAAAIRAVLAGPLDRRLDALAQGRPVPTEDILASLISQADPVTGRRFSRADLLDEVAMLFLAGHETSASGLAWAIYLLAIAPEVQDEVVREVLDVIGRRPPEFADMKALALTRNVFREALRLYPPVAVIARDADRAEAMCDRDIAAGSIVYCTPWIMHRQARFWVEPDAFKPRRFEAEAGKEAVRQAYFPFSMGPRVCPGAAFALQEATLALAMVVRRFAFEALPERPPRPIARLTLRAEDGVWLRLRARPAPPIGVALGASPSENQSPQSMARGQ